MSSLILPVILSGGAGTRLWPLSTEDLPKQFLRMWAGRSLFQDTLLRLGSESFLPPAVISNVAQEQLIRQDADDLQIALSSVVLEPARRDSAAAIAAATVWAEAKYGPDVVVAVFPSDHVIKDGSGFRRLVQQAAFLASSGYIVTFGIAPTRPATEYGYIFRGEPIPDHKDAFRVAQFREKPDAETARSYLASGKCDWNGGIFVFGAGVFREEAELHMGDILKAAGEAVLRGRTRDKTLELDSPAFISARKTSIDYALLEKSNRMAVMSVRFDWSDVGNWGTVHEALPSDESGNVFQGNVRARDCAGTLVISDGLPVRVLGLEQVAVVVTNRGVLITHLSHAARVKEVLD